MHTLEFNVLDFYMLRTPFFPLDQYADFFIKKRYSNVNEAIELMKGISSDPFFREALAVASYSLYESIPLLWGEDSKKRESTLRGLIRYLIRMTSRTTPFGLFSGVSIGKWDNKSDIVLNDGFRNSKKVNADMEWIIAVIKILESQDEILFKTKLTINSAAVDYISRIKIPNLSIHSDASIEEMSSDHQYHLLQHSTIRNTEAVCFVRDTLFYESVSFEQLMSKMQSRYPNVSEDTLVKFIKELITNEYIYTNIRTPMLIDSPLDYLIEWLEANASTAEMLPVLKDISNSIKSYELCKFGEGEKMVCEIIKKMREVHKCKSPLQIDMSVSIDQNKLSMRMKDDIAKATEIIWIISNKNNFQHLDQYHLEFLEKYGVGNGTPVLELLEVDLGLGAPFSYEHPSGILQDKGFSEANKMHPLFYQLYEQCLRKGEIEINLSEDDIDIFVKDYEAIENEVTIPRTVEMCFTIQADSKEAIDHGEYELIIGANQGSYGMGKIFGRFSQLLDSEYEPLAKEMQSIYKEFNSDAIFAEVTYLPKIARHANIVSNRSLFQYEIPLGTNASFSEDYVIPVSDLVVIADEKRLYLKSKKHNKEVIPFTSHMLSSLAGTPNIYRFLCEMGIKRLGPYPLFDLQELGKFNFSPRIKYKNIILNSATWRIKPNSIDFRSISSKDEFEQAFYRWKRNNRVPRFVFLTDQDARILFDLENPLFISELYKEFTKLDQYTYILLTEAIGNFEKSWIHNKENHNYNAEFVFPMYLSSANLETQVFSPFSNEQQSNYFPGDQWLYLKLYCSVDQTPQLIDEACSLINYLHSSNLIETGFYVNYIDPRNHLRLRLGGNQKDLLSSMSLIVDWTNNMRSKGLTQNVVYDTYVPELARYGGSSLMKDAEMFFMTDSLASGTLRKLNSDSLDSLDVAILSYCNLYEALFANEDDDIGKLNEIISYKDFVKEFRVRRNKLMNFWSRYKSGNYEDFSDLEKEICVTFDWRCSQLQTYYTKLMEAEANKSLPSHYDEIAFSLLHMHVNRLCGTDREEEKKIMTLSRHLLNNYKVIRKMEISI